MKNSKLAHTWWECKKLDEQVQIPASGGKSGSYVTPMNLSNSRTSLILCSEQREKREHVMSGWSKGWSVFQPGSCGNVHYPLIICFLCIWSAQILTHGSAEWLLLKPITSMPRAVLLTSKMVDIDAFQHLWNHWCLTQ